MSHMTRGREMAIQTRVRRVGVWRHVVAVVAEEEGLGVRAAVRRELVEGGVFVRLLAVRGGDESESSSTREEEERVVTMVGDFEGIASFKGQLGFQRCFGLVVYGGEEKRGEGGGKGQRAESSRKIRALVTE